MADDEKAGIDAAAEGAEADATESEAAGDAAEDAGADEGTDDGEAEGTKEGEGDKKPDAKDTKEKDDEPPTRKKPIDFILERKNRTIAKLKGGAGKGDKSSEAAGAGEGEDAVADEDKKLILDTVMPILEPVLKERADAQDSQELKTFLDANKDFKPYEAKIRKYMQHPSRAHLPIESIAYEVAGKDLLAIGAKRGKQADEKAKETTTGGGSAAGGGEKSVWDLTPAEFEAQQQKVRSGGK